MDAEALRRRLSVLEEVIVPRLQQLLSQLDSRLVSVEELVTAELKADCKDISSSTSYLEQE